MLLGFPVTEEGLRSLAEKRKINFGCAVRADYLEQDLDGGKYRQAVLRDYTMIEPENDLKPPALWQGIGKYDFSRPDFFVKWARENKLKVRGHVLLYARDDGYTIPGWFLKMEKDVTPDQAKIILKQYIQDVAGRYKGKIFAWDVINEAIDDKPTKNPFNLRDSFWFRKLGVDFVELAFRYAHEADPKCKLYYNDYSVEKGGPKTEQMLQLLDYLKSKKVPIHGVGLQFHRWAVEVPKPGDEFYQTLGKIRDRKLDFQMTELDLSVPVQKFERTNPNYGLLPTKPGDLIQQADSYEAFVRMALSFKNCQGIQLWGINDALSWIPSSTRGERGAALLLDKDYRPKDGYRRVAKVLVGD
jgi:endo-1,4-beta-xylanase